MYRTTESSRHHGRVVSAVLLCATYWGSVCARGEEENWPRWAAPVADSRLFDLVELVPGHSLDQRCTITDLAVSRSSQIAVAARLGTVRLVDSTGRLVWARASPGRAWKVCLFAPDDRSLAVAAPPRWLEVWDAQTGNPRFAVDGGLLDMGFSGRGLLIYLDLRGGVHAIGEAGNETWRFDPGFSETAEVGKVAAPCGLANSPSGSRMAVFGGGRKPAAGARDAESSGWVLECDTGLPECRIPMVPSPLVACVFLADSELLLFAESGEAYRWTISGAPPVRVRYSPAVRPIWTKALCDDAAGVVAVLGPDFSLAVYELATDHLALAWDTAGRAVTAVASDGQPADSLLIASGGAVHRLIRKIDGWSTERLFHASSAGLGFDPRSDRPFVVTDTGSVRTVRDGTLEAATAAAFAPPAASSEYVMVSANGAVAMVHRQGVMHWLKTETSERTVLPLPGDWEGASMVSNRTGSRCVVTTKTGINRVLDFSQARTIWPWSWQSDSMLPLIRNAAISGSGERVAMLDEFGVLVIDLDKAVARRVTLDASVRDMTRVWLSDHGSLLVLLDLNSRLICCDAERGSTLWSVDLGAPVSVIEFADSAKLLLAGTEDGTFRALDAFTGETRDRIDFGVLGEIPVRVAASPAGNRVACQTTSESLYVYRLKK